MTPRYPLFHHSIPQIFFFDQRISLKIHRFNIIYVKLKIEGEVIVAIGRRKKRDKPQNTFRERWFAT